MEHLIRDAPSRPIELRHASTDRPNVVVVPERHFLAIDGEGHPGAAGFRLATKGLRAAHEAVRAALRHDHFMDGPRSVFEIVWIADPDWSLPELLRHLSERDALRWRQMLELPNAATVDLVARAIARARAELGAHGPEPVLFSVTEGRSAQLLHIGATTDLSATVERLHTFITDSGWQPAGRIHQLVFADPEAVPSDRARSIIRMPIA
jgi:hypothetical protein